MENSSREQTINLTCFNQNRNIGSHLHKYFRIDHTNTIDRVVPYRNKSENALQYEHSPYDSKYNQSILRFQKIIFDNLHVVFLQRRSSSLNLILHFNILVISHLIYIMQPFNSTSYNRS